MFEFFAMGGYAAYVWSAFGFALLTMVGLLASSVINARKSAAEFDAIKADLRPGRGRSRQPMEAKRASQAPATETSGG